MVAKTTSERVKAFRHRQKAIGRNKREIYLTDKEFEIIMAKLKELRGN